MIRVFFVLYFKSKHYSVNISTLNRDAEAILHLKQKKSA